VAQVFLRGEKEQDYFWAMTELSRMIVDRGTAAPKAFVVDRDLALLNALECVFLTFPVQLCLWHIIKDVESHARKRGFPQELNPDRSTLRAPKWKDSSEHRAFCDAFVSVAYAPTEAEYDVRQQALHSVGRGGVAR
jgi:hypothetical protein